MPFRTRIERSRAATRTLAISLAVAVVILAFAAGAATQHLETVFGREDNCNRTADPIGCFVVISQLD